MKNAMFVACLMALGSSRGLADEYVTVSPHKKLQNVRQYVKRQHLEPTAYKIDDIHVRAPRFTEIKIHPDAARWIALAPGRAVLRATRFIYRLDYKSRGSADNDAQAALRMRAAAYERASFWVAEYNKDPATARKIEFAGIGFGPQPPPIKIVSREEKAVLGYEGQMDVFILTRGQQ